MTKDRSISQYDDRLWHNYFKGVELSQRDVRDPLNSSINLGPYVRKSLAMDIDWSNDPQELRIYHEWSPIGSQTYVPEQEMERYIDGTGPYTSQEVFLGRILMSQVLLFHSCVLN